MSLRKFTIEGYKGFARRAEIELAPLTVLVGPNNAGKSALARAIQLAAGGLAAGEDAACQPLPLESGGIRHGETFDDLLTEGSDRGCLTVSLALAGPAGITTLRVWMSRHSGPFGRSAGQIRAWRLSDERGETTVRRQGLDANAGYAVQTDQGAPRRENVVWRGILPKQPEVLHPEIASPVDDLRAWARGVRYLTSPRPHDRLPILAQEVPRSRPDSDGRDALSAPATSGWLRDEVAEWFRKTFGVPVDVGEHDERSVALAGTPLRGGNVQLSQSGQGLAQVFPVAATALTARHAGRGLDVVERPEAGLFASAHTAVTELILANLAGAERPMVVETHSELFLLRVRRWVAEGRLSPANVSVYWIEATPGRGSTVRPIPVRDDGEVESWPEGVFVEDFEEFMAIRRAARDREPKDRAVDLGAASGADTP